MRHVVCVLLEAFQMGARQQVTQGVLQERINSHDDGEKGGQTLRINFVAFWIKKMLI